MFLIKTLSVVLCAHIFLPLAYSQKIGDNIGGDIPLRIILNLKNETELQKVQINKNHASKINYLINLLKNQEKQKNPFIIINAVKALGRFREPRAVEILVANLNKVPKHGSTALFTSTAINFKQEHPAAQALVDIGLPSIPHVIYKMRQTKDIEITKLCTTIIYKILGFEFAEATLRNELTRIESSIKPSSLENEKDNLELSLKYLKKKKKKAKEKKGDYNKALSRDLYSTIQQTYGDIYLNKVLSPELSREDRNKLLKEKQDLYYRIYP